MPFSLHILISLSHPHTEMASEDEIAWSRSLHWLQEKSWRIKQLNNEEKNDILAAVSVCMWSLLDKGTPPSLKHTDDNFNG